jgi:hypothetical protein
MPENEPREVFRSLNRIREHHTSRGIKIERGDVCAHARARNYDVNCADGGPRR